MRIDLHTHSEVSDGTDPPAVLIRAAAAAGLDVVGLTDHDTTVGWDEAAGAATTQGVALVRGLEISTVHGGHGVHLLAYLPDPTSPPLVAALARILEGRRGRVPAMLARLQALGIDVAETDLEREDGRSAATGRPHVADALVRIGVVADRDEAFRRLLGPGRPAYVERYAAPLTEMIEVVTAAGGVSVVAHPWGRGGRAELGEDTIAELAATGLGGLEVDHRDHDATARARLRSLAADLDLVVTGSSDHHGAGKAHHELGCHTTAPEQYERLIGLAAEAAARSGRTTPGVVGGSGSAPTE